MTRPPGFLRRFLPVWGAGLLGIGGLLPQELPAAVREAGAPWHGQPELMLRLMLLLTPLLLVSAAAAAGAAVAHRVALRSVLAGDASGRLDVPRALGIGFLLALTLWAVDGVLADRLGPAWQAASARAAAAPWWPALLLGLLYGGLAEEVILRWGVMSLVIWSVTAGLRRSGAHTGPRAAAVAWGGILLAAALFALGHLPALAQAVELNGALLARTLGLNLLAGIAYGWLFWRRSLECAMLAHGATHVGLALARWLAL